MQAQIEAVKAAVKQCLNMVPAVSASPERIEDIRAGWIANAAIKAYEASRAPSQPQVNRQMVEALEGAIKRGCEGTFGTEYELAEDSGELGFWIEYDDYKALEHALTAAQAASAAEPVGWQVGADQVRIEEETDSWFDPKDGAYQPIGEKRLIVFGLGTKQAEALVAAITANPQQPAQTQHDGGNA